MFVKNGGWGGELCYFVEIVSVGYGTTLLLQVVNHVLLVLGANMLGGEGCV